MLCAPRCLKRSKPLRTSLESSLVKLKKLVSQRWPFSPKVILLPAFVRVLEMPAVLLRVKDVPDDDLEVFAQECTDIASCHRKKTYDF